MADWKLHCKHCGRAQANDETMADVQQHMITAHQTNAVDLTLVPHCSEDYSPFDLSDSGDSGQCPTCGRFEILRIPEEFRRD